MRALAGGRGHIADDVLGARPHELHRRLGLARDERGLHARLHFHLEAERANREQRINGDVMAADAKRAGNGLPRQHRGLGRHPDLDVIVPHPRRRRHRLDREVQGGRDGIMRLDRLGALEHRQQCAAG